MGFLGEKPDRLTLIAILCGFMGVALVLQPGSGIIAVGALFGLASGFFIACTKVLIRHMSSTEPVFRTMFYFSVLSTLYASLPLIWTWVTPSTSQFLIMAVAAACGTAGQLLLTYAFSHNPANRIAPYSYTIVVIATLIGWIGWSELPSMSTVFGALIVIGACLAMSFSGKLPDAWRGLRKSTDT